MLSGRLARRYEKHVVTPQRGQQEYRYGRDAGQDNQHDLDLRCRHVDGPGG